MKPYQLVKHFNIQRCQQRLEIQCSSLIQCILFWPISIWKGMRQTLLVAQTQYVSIIGETSEEWNINILFLISFESTYFNEKNVSWGKNTSLIIYLFLIKKKNSTKLQIQCFNQVQCISLLRISVSKQIYNHNHWISPTDGAKWYSISENVRFPWKKEEKFYGFYLHVCVD